MTTRLKVRVQPGARRTGLAGWMADGTLRLAVSAPPEDGKANRAVIALLAAVLEVRESALRMTRGARSRGKTIEVDGLDERTVASRIDAALDVARRSSG